MRTAIGNTAPARPPTDRWMFWVAVVAGLSACDGGSVMDAGPTPDATVSPRDAGSADGGSADGGSVDGGSVDGGSVDGGSAQDAGDGPCAPYAWLEGTFACTGVSEGQFACVLVSPGMLGADTCDLECSEVGGSQSLSIRRLPGGTTTTLTPETMFGFTAPPTSCVKQ